MLPSPAALVPHPVRPEQARAVPSWTPVASVSDRSDFAARLRPEAARPRVMFRPCRFSRLRRLAPRMRLQVCCTLLPTMGFAWLLASDPAPSARASTHCCDLRPVPVASTRVGRRGWAEPCRRPRLRSLRRRASGEPLPHRRSEDLLQATLREHTGRRPYLAPPEGGPGMSRCRHLEPRMSPSWRRRPGSIVSLPPWWPPFPSAANSAPVHERCKQRPSG
jgi:hypothetical protein